MMHTGNKPGPILCALARAGNSYDAEAVKRDGWRNQGILVVNADDERLDWTERELLKRIGNFLYGERHA